MSRGAGSGRPEQPPPPVVGRLDLPARSEVYLLVPAGWRLSDEGLRQLDVIVRAAHVPDGPGRSMGQRGSSVWMIVATVDAQMVVASLRDLAAEYLEKITPPERGG
jgi:hypothetical protein